MRQGGGVAVNNVSAAGANVTSSCTTSVMQAPLAVTTFPVHHQQQPTLVDHHAVLQQYSGNVSSS